MLQSLGDGPFLQSTEVMPLKGVVGAWPFPLLLLLPDYEVSGFSLSHVLVMMCCLTMVQSNGANLSWTRTSNRTFSFNKLIILGILL